jgi:RimJ/RimL family protein N-acetyltransferase
VSAPERWQEGGTVVRRWTVDDAATVATTVQNNLDHLAPWMPWAKPEVAEVGYQRARLTSVIARYDDDRAGWDFAIGSAPAAGAVIGACGILPRDGGVRVWYWLDHDHVGEGHATRAARMLTEMWRLRRAEPRLEIRCDEANPASAAIPQKLGYRLDHIATVEPETPSETGRMMVWVVDRSAT